MSNVVLVTGGFDPIHKGHIEYLKYAKELGDKPVSYTHLTLPTTPYV